MIRFLTRLLQVGVFSFAIAVLVWWLIGGSFSIALVISLSIGWSVHLAFELLHRRVREKIGIWLAPVPVVVIGLASGLLIAGLLVRSDPLYFFSRNYATAGLALFFGITGSLIFIGREQLYRTSRQLAETELRQSRQQKLLAETELKLLQAQIEPHFLFNTLSNITHLVGSKPQVAVAMLENLTTLLRATLAQTRSGESTLGQEMEFASAYIAIQSMRMGDRLSYTFNLPKELQDFPLPPLLVQPLLENAVLHGVEPQAEGGEVRFTARQTDDRLVLTVSDNGSGVSETGTAGGTGLGNIRDRLRLRYGQQATLNLMPADPRGVHAVISIPLQTALTSS